ncbi:MAG: hypothetical protein F9K32_16650 [Desulfobulbaceae bacterium]|nr:MAG: hypothetical protein F9K32_16650 [Desulfobulbaceae bacterium]
MIDASARLRGATTSPMLPCLPGDFGVRVFAHTYVNSRHIANYLGPLTDVEDGAMHFLVKGKWISALAATGKNKMARLTFASHADYLAVMDGLNRHGREIVDPVRARFGG